MRRPATFFHHVIVSSCGTVAPRPGQRIRQALTVVLLAMVVLAILARPREAQAQVYTLTDLGTLGGTESVALGMNAAGQVVGWSATTGNAAYHAFLYSGGVMTDLGTLGGTNSTGWGINAAGQVVGESETTPGNAAHHAFLYSGGVMTDLGTLGGTNSWASGINAAGEVVGGSETTGSVDYHAFLYRGGVMIDLNTLIVGGGAVTLTSARAINDAGQIVAIGFYNFSPGLRSAFLLDPTTPGGCPATLALEGPTSAVDLGTLRRFRDEVLSTSAGTRAYVDLFYRHSVEVVGILLFNGDLRQRVSELFREALPGVRAALNGGGGDFVLTSSRVLRINALLSAMGARGSPELRRSLERLQSDVLRFWGRSLKDILKIVKEQPTGDSPRLRQP